MKVILVLLVTCELCWTIRVPVTWNESESEESKKQDNIKNDEEFSVESFKPQYASSEAVKPQATPIPVEYFEYSAKKPQFAIDVAAFHGVQSPEKHYKAYPIKPYTGRVRPELGKHHIFKSENTLHKPFQDYTKINEDEGQVAPVSSSYEVFHPYEAETPALEEIYKDPILMKIRNDLENSRSRLQQYEKSAGEPDINKDEYLESPQKTDGKLFPQRHRPAPFEIHRPQRRPVYYRPAPVYKSQEQYLNHKLRHPWNHNIAKVRPMHYRPIKNYIHQLRQNHALKYDDERNEYPQVHILENYSDPKDGYDIYEKGRGKFVQLRNNVDESINKAVKENRPATYEKLEVQNDESGPNDEDNEEEFVPIKNYAQVRKTETFKHLPRAAALEDAETYDEIKNAPRLREAVKSTKAQTIYSEEGYEDAAYDHLGEQKHASENEGHGGFLKENELSGGKYKIPSVSSNYEDGNGSVYKDQIIHAEKWKDYNEDTKEEKDEENYSEDEHEHLIEADNHQEPDDDDNHRNKRENSDKNKTLSSSNTTSSNKESSNMQHEVVKHEIKFDVPQVDLNSTLFKDTEFLRISKFTMVPKKDNIKRKYPYYFKNLKSISRNSPLRYAENLKFIPKKSKGGTEFYDSRSKFECPEVDDIPEPIPEKLKGDGHPDENGESSEARSSIKDDENFDTTKKQPRLKGLGDKIDCFKAKYFGENPLDSPFFKEDTIMNPDPVFLPDIAAYKLKKYTLPKQNEETASKSYNVIDKSHIGNTSDLFELIEKLRNDQNIFQNSTLKSNTDFIASLNNHNNSNSSQLVDQSNVYDDVLTNIKNSLINITPLNHITQNRNETLNNANQSQSANNITYIHFQNKEDITKSPLLRKKRGASFLYEPYKIIRDGQVQDDSKRTTATSNISPLIRQLQLSKMIDSTTKLTSEEGQNVKRNINTRGYKNIGRDDREIKYGSSKNEKSFEDSEIVDVSFDKRRGEPRYEVKHVNHKSRYTPVTETKSMSKADYDAQKYNDKVATSKPRGENSAGRATRHKRPTENPSFNQSKFIPHTNEAHNTAASGTVRKTISPSTISPKSDFLSIHEKPTEPVLEENSSDEEYEDYDEEEDDEIITTSTTTTQKPAFRRKIRLQTTTQEPLGFIEEPRLKLVTRFRDYKTKDFNEKEHPLRQRAEDKSENTTKKIIENHDESIAPKFREKKKKITKSTLVTDTKKYGDTVDNDDEMMQEEVDALIGVKHDLDDYEPLYAKNGAKKSNEETLHENVSKENKDADDDDYNDESDENGSYEDDEDDDGEESDDEEDEDIVDDGNESAADKEDENTEQEPKATSPEPTKRTLVITTDAPIPTTAFRSAKIQAKPIVTRKKIEVHKELPVNKSSPHFTQFKQDIKEIEVIKETSNPLKRKPSKNVEVFDLYKDDNLAKDINQLGVEIFKENLNLRQGPKHGGNYKSVELNSTVPTREKPRHSKDDAEASQSENMKNIELDDVLTGDDSKPQRVQNKRARNFKVIDASDTAHPAMHGGNLRHKGKSRMNNSRSQRLIELDEEHEDDSSHEDESYSSSKNERPMHGGNYRSAKLTDEKHPYTTEMSKARSKDARRNAALVLNSFVQAAPVLTTTPGYIVDPSKRKYYYVDA